MRKGHVSWQCRSTNKCARCGGHHHLRLCSQEEGAKTKKTRVPSVPKHASTMNLPHLLQQSTSGKTILLQTVSAVAFNPSNPQKREFVLF